MATPVFSIYEDERVHAARAAEFVNERDWVPKREEIHSFTLAREIVFEPVQDNVDFFSFAEERKKNLILDNAIEQSTIQGTWGKESVLSSEKKTQKDRKKMFSTIETGPVFSTEKFLSTLPPLIFFSIRSVMSEGLSKIFQKEVLSKSRKEEIESFILKILLPLRDAHLLPYSLTTIAALLASLKEVETLFFLGTDEETNEMRVARGVSAILYQIDEIEKQTETTPKKRFGEMPNYSNKEEMLANIREWQISRENSRKEDRKVIFLANSLLHSLLTASSPFEDDREEREEDEEDKEERKEKEADREERKKEKGKKEEREEDEERGEDKENPCEEKEEKSFYFSQPTITEVTRSTVWSTTDPDLNPVDIFIRSRISRRVPLILFFDDSASADQRENFQIDKTFWEKLWVFSSSDEKKKRAEVSEPLRAYFKVHTESAPFLAEKMQNSNLLDRRWFSFSSGQVSNSGKVVPGALFLLTRIDPPPTEEKEESLEEEQQKLTWIHMSPLPQKSNKFVPESLSYQIVKEEPEEENDIYETHQNEFLFFPGVLQKVIVSALPDFSVSDSSSSLQEYRGNFFLRGPLLNRFSEDIFYFLTLGEVNFRRFLSLREGRSSYSEKKKHPNHSVEFHFAAPLRHEGRSEAKNIFAFLRNGSEEADGEEPVQQKKGDEKSLSVSSSVRIGFRVKSRRDLGTLIATLEPLFSIYERLCDGIQQEFERKLKGARGPGCCLYPAARSSKAEGGKRGNDGKKISSDGSILPTSTNLSKIADLYAHTRSGTLNSTYSVDCQCPTQPIVIGTDEVDEWSPKVILPYQDRLFVCPSEKHPYPLVNAKRSAAAKKSGTDTSTTFPCCFNHPQIRQTALRILESKKETKHEEIKKGKEHKAEKDMIQDKKDRDRVDKKDRDRIDKTEEEEKDSSISDDDDGDGLSDQGKKRTTDSSVRRDEKFSSIYVFTKIKPLPLGRRGKIPSIMEQTLNFVLDRNESSTMSGAGTSRKPSFSETEERNVFFRAGVIDPGNEDSLIGSILYAIEDSVFHREVEEILLNHGKDKTRLYELIAVHRKRLAQTVSSVTYAQEFFDRNPSGSKQRSETLRKAVSESFSSRLLSILHYRGLEEFFHIQLYVWTRSDSGKKMGSFQLEIPNAAVSHFRAPYSSSIERKVVVLIAHPNGHYEPVLCKTRGGEVIFSFSEKVGEELRKLLLTQNGNLLLLAAPPFLSGGGETHEKPPPISSLSITSSSNQNWIQILSNSAPPDSDSSFTPTSQYVDMFGKLRAIRGILETSTTITEGREEKSEAFSSGLLKRRSVWKISVEVPPSQPDAHLPLIEDFNCTRTAFVRKRLAQLSTNPAHLRIREQIKRHFFSSSLALFSDIPGEGIIGRKEEETNVAFSSPSFSLVTFWPPIGFASEWEEEEAWKTKEKEVRMRKIFVIQTITSLFTQMIMWVMAVVRAACVIHRREFAKEEVWEYLFGLPTAPVIPNEEEKWNALSLEWFVVGTTRFPFPTNIEFSPSLSDSPSVIFSSVAGKSLSKRWKHLFSPQTGKVLVDFPPSFLNSLRIFVFDFCRQTEDLEKTLPNPRVIIPISVILDPSLSLISVSEENRRNAAFFSSLDQFNTWISGVSSLPKITIQRPNGGFWNWLLEPSFYPTGSTPVLRHPSLSSILTSTFWPVEVFTSSFEERKHSLFPKPTTSMPLLGIFDREETTQTAPQEETSPKENGISILLPQSNFFACDLSEDMSLFIRKESHSTIEVLKGKIVG